MMGDKIKLFFRRKIQPTLQKIAEPLIFIGAVTAVLPKVFKKRGLRAKEFKYYFDLCGVRSLPIVLLLCFLLGLIMAYQSALQLQKFGADVYVADLIAFSIVKEFGPLMVAIIFTGRAGSAFAAEIGAMRANDEISALTTLGISPVAFLFLPKLVAMLLAAPLLTIFGDAAGIFGGMVIGSTQLGIPISTYLQRTADTVSLMTLALGTCKCFVFAYLVTWAGCYCGFRAQGNAQGVGRAATSAVVLSLFLIIAADSLIAVFYSFFGY